MKQGLSLSVGIPAYNQGKFLEETLRSLVNQRRPVLEIVVSDHQSTDETPEVIAAWVAKYPELIRGVQPPVGVGISGQWNFTFGQLKGDWVTLLSSDDVALPNFCEVLLRAAEREPKAVLARAGWENIGPAGERLSTEYLLSASAVTPWPENLLEQRHGPKASFAAFAVRRQALVESGGYPSGFESFGDWPLFAQLAPFGPFVYEAEIISGYRIGYGGDKFITRAPLWIRDEQRMFYAVLPRAAWQGEMKDLTWIEKASRANFMRYLSTASEKFAPQDRSPLVPLLQPWAKRTGKTKELEIFAQGGTVVASVPLKELMRSVLRPAAQRLYRRLKGH